MLLLLSCAPSPAPVQAVVVEEEVVELAPPLTVCLQPLGVYEEDSLALVGRGIETLYGFETRVLPERTMPREAYYAPNDRWRADTLVDRLADELWPDADCSWVLGFTAWDISTTKGKVHDWGIFGLGLLGGRAAMVSTWRLKEGRGVERRRGRRLVKVANHEVGHMLGLPHVNVDGCLMHDAEGSIRTVDSETGLLCDTTRDFIEGELSLALPALERFPWENLGL